MSKSRIQMTFDVNSFLHEVSSVLLATSRVRNAQAVNLLLESAAPCCGSLVIPEDRVDLWIKTEDPRDEDADGPYRELDHHFECTEGMCHVLHRDADLEHLLLRQEHQGGFMVDRDGVRVEDEQDAEWVVDQWDVWYLTYYFEDDVVDDPPYHRGIPHDYISVEAHRELQQLGYTTEAIDNQYREDNDGSIRGQEYDFVWVDEL